MNFSNFIKSVSDFRRKEGQRYSFESVLWLIFSAVSCGYISNRNISNFGKIHFNFFKKKFGWHSYPSYYVIHTFFKGLDSVKFCKSFNDWLSQELSASKKEYWLSADGQALRSTVSEANTPHQNYVALVSIFCEEIGLTLALSSYENKAKDTGEASTLLELIEGYFMETGVTFTMDALHCQKNFRQNY